jgi:hypothetical protein
MGRRVARSAPEARSAERRLADLRLRAQLLNPGSARVRVESGLRRAAQRALGIGLRSLLSRAAPGLGSALAVVRMVWSLGRQLERGISSGEKWVAPFRDSTLVRNA